MMLCIYRGRCRSDLPHRGACCTPYECRHERTPRIVNLRICGPRRCRFHTTTAEKNCRTLELESAGGLEESQ